MSLDANKMRALAFLQSISARQPDMDLVAPDFTFWLPTRGELDKAKFLALSAGLQSMLAEPLHWEILNVTAEEDRVSVEATGTAVLADGSPYRNDYHILFVMAGDRIARMREYNNSIVAAEAFGRPTPRS